MVDSVHKEIGALYKFLSGNQVNGYLYNRHNYHVVPVTVCDPDEYQDKCAFVNKLNLPYSNIFVIFAEFSGSSC